MWCVRGIFCANLILRLYKWCKWIWGMNAARIMFRKKPNFLVGAQLAGTLGSCDCTWWRCAPTRLQKRPRQFVLPSDNLFYSSVLIVLLSWCLHKGNCLSLLSFVELKLIYRTLSINAPLLINIEDSPLQYEECIPRNTFMKTSSWGVFSQGGGRCFCLESSDLPVFPGWKCQVGPTWPAASSSLLINELSMTTRASR